MTPERCLRLATDALRANQIDQSRDLAQKGLKLNPKNKRTRASLLNIIGNTFTSNGSMDEAGEYFRQSIKADPAFALPHGNLGNLLFMKKDFAKAEMEFKHALKLNPNYPDAYNNLGILYKTQKKYDLAKQSFNNALKLDPELKVARENLETIQNLS